MRCFLVQHASPRHRLQARLHSQGWAGQSVLQGCASPPAWGDKPTHGDTCNTASACGSSHWRCCHQVCMELSHPSAFSSLFWSWSWLGLALPLAPESPPPQGWLLGSLLALSSLPGSGSIRHPHTGTLGLPFRAPARAAHAWTRFGHCAPDAAQTTPSAPRGVRCACRPAGVDRGSCTPSDSWGPPGSLLHPRSHHALPAPSWGALVPSGSHLSPGPPPRPSSWLQSGFCPVATDLVTALRQSPPRPRLPQVTSSTCEPRLGTALAGLALPCPLPWPCGHFLCDAAPTRPGPATPHVPPCARVARSHPLVYTPVRGSRCALLIRVSLGPGLPRVLSDCPWCE